MADLPKLPTIPTVPGTGSVSGSSFDPDAAAYFTRAGVTDATAKTKISDCFIQLKAASLWTDITQFKIGRSAYNKGSGLTVYDCKNAAMDGTIEATGPAWGVDGLVYDSAQDAVTTPQSQSMDGSWTAFSVMKDGAGDTGANRRVIGTANANGATLIFLQNTNKASTLFGCFDGATAVVSTGFVNATTFRMLGLSCSPGNQTFYDNDSVVDTQTIVLDPGTHTIQMGSSRAANESMTAGVFSVMIIYGSREIVTEDEAALYAILKATICSDQLP